MRNEGKGEQLTNETIKLRGKKDKGTLTLRTHEESIDYTSNTSRPNVSPLNCHC